MTENFDQVCVRSKKEDGLVDFLRERDFQVEILQEDLLKVSSPEIIDVYIHIKNQSLFFEIEIGIIENFASEELYKKLLDLNTEILPVSLGLDTTSSEKPRLVIVESREIKNLDENEILCVFEAFEIASAKVEVILSQYIK